MSGDDGVRKILVVDDEADIRDVLMRVLARLPRPPPVEIVAAESAEEALTLMEASEYDLLLTDFNMGGRDGVFLLAAARTRWPATVRMLMTGYTDQEIARQARERGGAVHVFQKPWDNRELLLTVRSALLADGT